VTEVATAPYYRQSRLRHPFDDPFREGTAPLILLHTTGFAWDELLYIIVPSTLLLGLLLAFIPRDRLDQ